MQHPASLPAPALGAPDCWDARLWRPPAPSQLAVSAQVMGKGQFVQAVTPSEVYRQASSRVQEEGRASFKTGRKVAHAVWWATHPSLVKRGRGWVPLGMESGTLLSCKALNAGLRRLDHLVLPTLLFVEIEEV